VRKGVKKMYSSEKHNFENISDLIVEYSPGIKSNIAIALEANKGVDAQTFFDIVKLSGYSKDEMARVFSTSVKTFSRYEKENKKLSPLRSELILKIIALFKKGIEVFGGLESFKAWLAKPAYGLGGHTPFSLIHTSTGIDLVQDELTRIEFGDLA
jgi:putative toxin-antitoxin system antitoxin component (TIGR02293 family)